jgi:hypothetical protein
VHSHLKEKQISVLTKEIKDLVKKQQERVYENKKDILVDQLVFNEFKSLKNLIKEKDEKLLSKDEELLTLQTTQNK